MTYVKVSILGREWLWGGGKKANRYLWRKSCQPFMQGIGRNGSGKQQAARRMSTNKAQQRSPAFSLPSFSIIMATHLLRTHIHFTDAYTIYPSAHHIHPEHHDQCLFCAAQPLHHPTSQLRFCSLIFVHYVLILYDYQMAFSPICSAVYALGLVRLISRCYAVPQCSTYFNRCLLVPGLSIPFGFSFAIALLVLACTTLFYWSSLCSCRATVHIPFSCIRIPSSSCYRASFLTNNISGISCHVRRFIGKIHRGR